ncbi:MAG TPA: LLM class flavin-dependent oxidoreductase [Acidimicrobiales bacterium]|nr:LLM class flavin-dependent oxidoreductase [Acidimicrobiales bacterium]
MNFDISILDLVPIRRHTGPGEALAASRDLAQEAERLGYKRIWYAEHHNMASIGSAATSVVIAYIGAHTARIRIGAGGIMLPNHSPLVVAEQFGTLEALYPGRVDLGLGRAPGTDRRTVTALRRSDLYAEHFPDDVLEIQGYLQGPSRVPGVEAVPGKGSVVPLYILGSSLFGAQLAASYGLPFAFASHFAPAALSQAVAAYRADFRPSRQCSGPYVIAGVNVLAAGTHDEAHEQFEQAKRSRIMAMFGRERALSEAEVDAILISPAGRHVEELLTFSAVGTATEVVDYLQRFAQLSTADELMTVHPSPTDEQRLQSVRLLADAAGLAVP